MASQRKDLETKKPTGLPATTPEAREQQLIGLAVDLAERQLLTGEASSQVITHYLKLASTREKLEQERLRSDIAMVNAKVDAIASGKRVEELYEEALSAMRRYSGQDPPNQEFDD